MTENMEDDYFEKAYKKQYKSQAINFEKRLWNTINFKPQIGNSIFLNKSLYLSAKARADKEFGFEKDEIEEKENRILEIYTDEGGRLEIFNSANYPVPASLNQIYELTFKNRQYQLSATVVVKKIDYFFTPIGFTVPFVRTDNFITPPSTPTLPEFTENYERMIGQIHSSPNLTIDTTLIFRKNGRYYPKIRASGLGFTSFGIGVQVGVIPFLGGGIPMLFNKTQVLALANSELVTPLNAFGSIKEVDTNSDGVKFENRSNWSLSKEIKEYEKGKIERQNLSNLAQETIKRLNLSAKSN